MDTWLQIIGQPLLETGRTRLFGRGQNPINFVAAQNVAQVLADCLAEGPRHQVIDLGGPDNLSFTEFADIFQAASGTSGRVSHIPLPAMRVAAVLLRPFQPSLARQIQAGVVMDTADMTYSLGAAQQRYLPHPITLAELVAGYGGRSAKWTSAAAPAAAT
jgi:NADH dehydrogenase